MISKLFSSSVEIQGNLIYSKNVSSEIEVSQEQTKDTFSEKWIQFEEGKKKDEVYEFQKDWFLKLYGFNSEKQLQEYLSDKQTILDAGCGLGYKAAWFAALAPMQLLLVLIFLKQQSSRLKIIKIYLIYIFINLI